MRLKNLRAAASLIGIHGAEGEPLRIHNLDISGSASSGCATGIKLDGVADSPGRRPSPRTTSEPRSTPSTILRVWCD